MDQDVELAPGLFHLFIEGIDLVVFGDVAGNTSLALTDSARGRTRFSRASPKKLNPSSAPSAWKAWAIPQAMDRSLATRK